jgi:hypothetical protein
MKRDREFYDRFADYCWRRAHKATSAKWRTVWFDCFEVATAYRDMMY